MQPVRVKSLVLGDGIPKICVPLMGKNQDCLLKELEQLENLPVDLVEWRIDACAEGAEEVRQILPALRAACPWPLLCTFRTRQEGGLRAISAEAYRALLLAILESGCADLIDIELFAGSFVPEMINAAREAGVVSVVSSHDFQSTPEEVVLFGRFEQMHRLGADLPKSAVMPHTPQDVLHLLAATRRAADAYGPVISMAMGSLGVVSRVAGETFGSCLTFGAAAQASAPGQLDVQTLHTILCALHRPEN